MKRTLLCMFILTALTASAQYEQIKEGKGEANSDLSTFKNQRSELFNFDWKFRLITDADSLADYTSPDCDDSNWRNLDLPHDFQFEQPWVENGNGARGFKPSCQGIYRKTFIADTDWKGKLVSLDLGGIMCIGDVYLNGKKIASTEYGYVGMEADLTKDLLYGEKNVIAVYASTGKKKGSRWYTGGGMFRDVYLKITNATHIARHGIYVTTPNVSPDSADVLVNVEVANWRNHKDVTIDVSIKDRNGNVVGNTTRCLNQLPDKHKNTEVMLPLVNIKNPNLWDIDNPYLYTTEVELKADGMTVDRMSRDFGIRKIEFSPEFGFKLNGRKVFLKGHSGHHDLGALGAAAFDKGIERMMLKLKEFGFNTIRCSHNPYSESFCQIADRVGMLVVDELFDKWSDKDYWSGRQPLTTVWPGLMAEWIKRDRNSPSVIMWSLGNELQIREDWTGYPAMNDWGVTMYKIMDQVAKRFDPSRHTTVAQFPAKAGSIVRKDKAYADYAMPPELACATEIASLNYQSEWYDAFLKNKPDLILFQSEAESYKWLEPYVNMNYERSVGMAYWGAIEYWGESNKWPKKGWNYSFFNHTVNPYPQAYLLRSTFKPEEPTVRIGVLSPEETETISWNDVNVGQTAMLEHWNFEEGSKKQIYVFTNAHSVELSVNGKSLGIKENNGEKNMTNVIVWKDVNYGNGGTISAIARDENGKEVARHQLTTAKKATELEVKTETANLMADGMDLMYIDISAVDSKGRRDVSYNEPISVKVNGAATFVALDNGDHYTDDLFYGVTEKKMRNGYMQLIVRSKRTAGEVAIDVKSGKMSRKIKFQTKQTTDI